MSTDQDLHRASDAIKSNLNEGVAAAVPRGDEPYPVERIDPMASRKAMFKKADKLREVEEANNKGADPAVIAALQAEARGDEPATVRETDQMQGQPPAKEANAGQSSSQYVTIQTDSGPISVSKADIDREGTVELYLRRRQMDEVAMQDKAEIARLRHALEESNRFRQEQVQAQPAGQDGPATSPARTTGRGESLGASEQELAELASHLAQQIYSGDENDAKAAILQILQRPQGNTLSAEEVERRVREAVAKVAPQAAQPTAVAVPTNPRLDEINRQINEMAARDYADVCKDDIARSATFAYFKRLVALPENRDRRAVDVARDACEWGRAKFMDDPRSRIVEQKRGLPSSTAASGATDTATEEQPLTPSQVVEMQRTHRNFGRRIPN